MHTLADTTDEKIGAITFYKLKTSYSYHTLVLHHSDHSYIVHVLFVSDTNLDCNMAHVPYVPEYCNFELSGEKSSSTDKLPLGFRGSVIINRPGKMAGNRISLVNAGPRLNTGLEKTPGQKFRILIKCRGDLIEKIR